MRKFLTMLIICSFTSCNFFDSADEKTQKLVNQELKSIDWTNVDHYPLFDDCDENASKATHKDCFIETLSLHFGMSLHDFEPVVNNAIRDTIFVDFTVENTGAIVVKNILNKEVLQGQVQEFDTKINQSLSNLPRIAPALKRGIPVKTTFRIPIVLSSK